MTALDFNEPAIRDMVDRHHTPEETWTYTSSSSTSAYQSTLVSVSCNQCREPWPCTALRSLREWLRLRS